MRTPRPTILVLAALGFAADVGAGGDPGLLLPLRAALAIVEHPPRTTTAVGPIVSSRWRGRTPGAFPSPPAFIPKRIHIPDLYAIDFERDAPRFAEPVDGDRMVAFELMAPAQRRPGLSFIYDTESLPIGESSDRISVRFEWPF